MSLRSWSIRTLFPLMAGSIILAVVLTAFGAFMAARQASDAQKDVKVRIETLEGVSKIEFLADRIQFNNLIQQYRPGQTTAGQDITRDLTSIEDTANTFNGLPLSSPERSALAGMHESFGKFSYWLGTLKPPDNAQESADVGSQYKAYVAANAGAMLKARQILTARLVHQQQRLTDAIRLSLVLEIVLGLTAGLVVGSGILLIGRSINKRLEALRNSLQAMADGDLTQRVPAGGQQELAEIGSNVNAVLDQFSRAFTSLGQTSRQLGSAATALETLAADVGRKAEETSAQADVVARTADEVSQNVQAMAAGGEQMGSSISEISRNANQAARVAIGAVQAVESTTATMSKLGDSSREIGDVIRLITTIAEQTNLLALNATIEAARAGDAGKGFAVVADEVKQLAQETARATENISNRVETIQQDAVQAARAISEIAGVITRINEFQTTIASAVEQQTATTQAINAGVGVAATGSGQIASSIAGVADAAGVTAHSMSQAQGNARELSRMSDELAALVAGFRLS